METKTLINAVEGEMHEIMHHMHAMDMYIDLLHSEVEGKEK